MNTITIYRGDTLSLPVTVTNDDSTAFNLTGYVMKLTVKRQKDDADSAAVIATKTATISVPSSGIGTFSFSTTETNLAAGKYYYDVQISTPITVPTFVRTIIEDEFNVLNDITRG